MKRSGNTNIQTQTNHQPAWQLNLIWKLDRLAKLANRDHTYCADEWYSCPKIKGGTLAECDCGADEHNDEIALLVGELTELLLSISAYGTN